jgi:enoyl-CoA hydratase/carnithine racemase
MTTVARTDRDGVAELLLDRPQRRNALTTAMLADLRDQLESVAGDASVRALVLCGAGAAFCSGADTDELAGADAPADGSLRRIRLVSEALRRIGELDVPTIAAVHGHAIGAGWGLALACDLCFATTDVRFCLPEVAHGYRIPQLLMRRLAQVVGPVRAAELAFAGTAYGAGDALAAGCVTRVLEDRDAVVAEAHALAGALAAQPRNSVATAKQPLRALAPHVPLPPPELTWTEEQ